QLIIHRLVTHAGLDHCKAETVVDLQNAIHPVAEIDNDLSSLRGGTAAEPDIVASADRIERHSMGVGTADDLLHVGSRRRVNHAGRPPVAPGHGILAITAQCLLAAVDGIRADSGADVAEEHVKRGFHDCPRELDLHQIPVFAAISVLANAAGAGSPRLAPLPPATFRPPLAPPTSSTTCPPRPP